MRLELAISNRIGSEDFPQTIFPLAITGKGDLSGGVRRNLLLGAWRARLLRGLAWKALSHSASDAVSGEAEMLARVGEAAFEIDAFLFDEGGLVFLGRVGDGDDHGPHEWVAGSGQFFEFRQAGGGGVWVRFPEFLIAVGDDLRRAAGDDFQMIRGVGAELLETLR